MSKFRVSILVAEDFEPFRQFVCATFCGVPGLDVICEVSDGVAAVQKAEALQPNVVLLDIGLPSLNGIEAARHIARVAPAAKILFLSQESSAEIVQAAIEAGGHGYVVKTDAGKELVTAVDCILRGERFIGSRFWNIPLGNPLESASGRPPRPVCSFPVRTKIV